MNLLTIFTPSYNRAYILPKLYESLKRQTDKRFEWVIVDDGSVDDTESLVNGWINESLININYQKQQNQGKHIAINTGVEMANGELFFIVDSDDQLTLNAVEKVFIFWNSHKTDENISGILSYRQFPDGKRVGSALPSYVKQCKLRESSSKYGSIGDKVVIYRTELFRKFKFPKFANECFLGESYVYNQIDDIADMLVMNEMIYIFDYQLDGLSQNFRNLYRKSPLGFQAMFIQGQKYCPDWKSALKNKAHICCLAIHNHNLLKVISHCGLSFVLAFPIGLLLYLKIFIMKISDVKPFMEKS